MHTIKSISFIYTLKIRLKVRTVVLSKHSICRFVMSSSCFILIIRLTCLCYQFIRVSIPVYSIVLVLFLRIIQFQGKLCQNFYRNSKSWTNSKFQVVSIIPSRVFLSFLRVRTYCCHMCYASYMLMLIF